MCLNIMFVQGVLLVEGLMVLHNEQLRNKMDVRIYVDCDEDTRFMRRLARDTHPLKGRGRTVAQVYEAWCRYPATGRQARR